MSMQIGIIVADDGEFNPLVEKIGKREAVDYFGRDGYSFVAGDIKALVLHCGIGKVNAAAAAMYLYSKGCNVILNYGYSGGISGVKKGDVVISDRFLEHDFDLTCLGYRPCEKPAQEYIYNADEELMALLGEIYPTAKKGLAVSGDCFISNDDLRNKMKNQFGAVSCDMETAAIASVCYQTGMRFASIRQISDDAGNDAKDSYASVAYSGDIEPVDGLLALIQKLSERK
ncbi:MAG: 5'-methylthioadenosine/S-adenosylhomocysteine nucleosidase [Clostridia bacterium]|nr:5'-methylthioadenosine/S-adenosylhomocysteine nucleosidase [Clostridia bacterium]